MYRRYGIRVKKVGPIFLVAAVAVMVMVIVGACGRGEEPTPTATPGTPTVVGGVPPPIPHSLVARSQCTTCHGAGISEIPAMPTGHAGRFTNELCTICHRPFGEEATGPPPSVPHTLVGRSECLICHASGIASAPAVPASHEGRSNGECLLCHRATGRAVATPTPTLATPSTPGATSPVPPTPTPTAAAPGAPPLIPHSLEGRADCLLCHAATIPASHAGRTSDICTQCHKPAGVPGATPTPTPTSVSPPTPTATPPAPPTPTPTAAAPGAPPLIPHSLEGRADCLLCHATTIPPGHEGRTNEMCTLCHKPEAS